MCTRRCGNCPPNSAELVLAYYGGYTQREVTTTTGVPIGTRKSRMFTGTHLLRRLLTPMMPELAATAISTLA